MENTEQKRGQLTQRIKDKSMELLGYEMSIIELRLLPYIQYVLTNSQRLDPNAINEADRQILSKYVDRGFIINGVTGKHGRPMISKGEKLKVTHEFWGIITEILWLGYVDLQTNSQLITEKQNK